MMNMLKRWRWALSLGLLLLLALTFAFWPTTTPVDMGEVSRGPMVVGITDDGVTRAEEYYVVSAPVTGYLDRIELEAGDTVSSGTLITTMRGRPSSPLDRRTQQELRGSLAAANAAAEGARASLTQARNDLARAEQLAQRGFLPTAQLEAARTRVTTGEATLAQARAEASRIRAALSPGGSAGDIAVPVRAPEAGSVMSVTNESAGVIPEGTPLLTIGDPTRIEVVVDLLSREAVRVSPGDEVLITQWGGPAPLAGTVDRIEPFGRLKVSALGIEEQRVNVIVAFAPEARDAASRLGHGYQIDATMVLWRSEDALRVPIGALFRGQDGNWRVFVNDGGRARERPIELGQINDEFAEVKSGLAEGDAVIVNPGNQLREGDRIESRDPD